MATNIADLNAQLVADANAQQSQSDCLTFKWTIPSIPVVSGAVGLPSSDLCFDGIVGIAAMWMGLSIIAIGVVIVVMSSRAGRTAIRTAAVVAK